MTPNHDQRTEAEIRRVSIHEASHLVLAYLFGCRPSRASASIDQEGKRWGHVAFSPPLERTRCVALYVAGMVGEKLAIGRINDSGGRQDMADIAAVIGDEFPRGQFKSGILLALRLLERNWSLVRRVARTLREKRDLDKATIARLFHSTPRLKRKGKKCFA